MYYIYVELKDGSRDYVCAPSGWRWTDGGAVKDGTDHRKSVPEMSQDPHKKHFFASLAAAKIQANKIISAKIIEC